MRLLQVTALFFLLSNSLCRGEDSKGPICGCIVDGVQTNFTPSLAETSTTKASATTPDMVSGTNLNKTTGGTPPEGTTNNATLKTPPLLPALNSPTTPKHETTTRGVMSNEVSTIKTTVPNSPTSNAVSTLSSPQHKTENQSSIRTTETSVTNQLPNASPKTTETPSASLTTAKTISQLQDTEDGKITATSSTTPSYSSIILPVVIALIVITLLVFTLVGLYRICWKRDPGTPESGNDQPQSDKESVKLLTVKTISPESGEPSAQGKTKN